MEAATSVPTQALSQTASGVIIFEQDQTYYTMVDVNMRSDCSKEDNSNIIRAVVFGTALTSTGISEDGKWIEVVLDGTTGYIDTQYVSTSVPATDDIITEDTSLTK